MLASDLNQMLVRFPTDLDVFKDLYHDRKKNKLSRTHILNGRLNIKSQTQRK